MQTLTINTPFAKESVKELELEASQTIKKQKDKLHSIEFYTATLTVLLFVITCLTLMLDEKHVSLVISFSVATGIVGWITITTRFKLNHFPSIQELVFCEGKSGYIDVAIAEQDLQLAQFIEEINIQERELTRHEDRFLCNYVSKIETRREEAEQKKKFNQLLLKRDINNA